MSTRNIISIWGLSLSIFVNQPEYIGVLSESAGIRLAVHRQDQEPFVEDDGINVGVGQKLAVRIRLVSDDETSNTDTVSHVICYQIF